MAVKNYNPDEVSVILGTSILGGFADGDSIKVTQNEDDFTLVVGSQGQGTRTRNANKSARVELAFQQTSESNAVMQAALNADRNSSSGVTLPFLLKDNSGNDLHTAETMWIVKQSDASYGKDATNRVWILETDRMVSSLGGN